MDAISDWTADEILLEHSRTITFLLHKLQAVLAGGALRATGFLALFYTAVLFTEGIGVYMEQRWAELLMIFATAGLIPIEIRHLWHRPGLVGALILLANCFIVWFLYRVLKRDKIKRACRRLSANWSRPFSAVIRLRPWTRSARQRAAITSSRNRGSAVDAKAKS